MGFLGLVPAIDIQIQQYLSLKIGEEREGDHSLHEVFCDHDGWFKLQYVLVGVNALGSVDEMKRWR